jgi:hypothetical protein
MIENCPVHPDVKLIGDGSRVVASPTAGFCSRCNRSYKWSTGEVVQKRQTIRPRHYILSALRHSKKP